MIHRRLSRCAFLALVILVSQFVPFGNNIGVAAAARCNSAAFVTDVTVRDGSVFSPGAAFVKTWRLKNTGTCTWTSAYGMAFVSGDPLGATTSMTIPTTAPGQTMDISFDMNAPTTPGHYRGYWMLKDAQGLKFGLGINADQPFWVDINVSGSLTIQPTPGTGLMLQGTVRLNGVGLAGVRIYRSYASYPGTLVATTGADGRYSADFMPIPGRETVTVKAELAGYTFDPVNYSWLHEHSFESKTLDFTAIPSSITPPPSDGTVFDFTKEMCAATWKSGAGTLPCPGTDGDARGFALKVNSPRLENGSTDSAPGLVVFPQNKFNGYIQGFFPAYTVQPGDHFRTIIGCAYGSACYVTFRLDYEVSGATPQVFWSWQEKNEGKIYQLDKDLSALAGKKVNFILTLLATGDATNDRALWGQPRIVHSGGTIPTDTPITPAPTTVTPPTVSPPPPSTGVILDFAADPCKAAWRSGAGVLPCPGTDGDARGFVLPVNNPRLENGANDNAAGLILFPQNKFNGYIQGTYPEITVQAGDRFQSIVNCTYGSSCYVTFRLDYEVSGATPKVFWSWQEKNEGMFYRVDKDLSALAGKKVKFTLTILATGLATGDRALWSQPRIVRAGAVPTTPPPATTPPTSPPPTDTPIPAGNVTEVKASVKIPEFVNCASILSAELIGSITTSGPATVKYHWEVSGVNNYTTSESTLEFSSAGTQPANASLSLGCGTYLAKLVVTSPNAISAQSDFTLSIPTVLPIYDFNTFKVIGTMACSEFTSHTWRQEPCNGESGGCWISQTPLFENNYAGFFRHDGNTICGLNLP